MLLPAPGHLNRIVTVKRARFDLAHCAGPELNYGYSAHPAGRINRLSHSNFLANESAQHFLSPIQR
jgi:hypothetical protein